MLILTTLTPAKIGEKQRLDLGIRFQESTIIVLSGTMDKLPGVESTSTIQGTVVETNL